MAKELKFVPENNNMDKNDLIDYSIQPDHDPLSPDTISVEPPPKPRIPERPRSVTFPLRWRLYSLVFFLVIGTSIAFLLMPFLLFAVLEIFMDIPTEQMGVILFIGGVPTMIWFGYRTFQDFRQKISFSPTGITLRTNRGHESVTWDQIRHIEPLQNLIVIQISSTAVVLRLSPKKYERVLSLISRHYPFSSTMPKTGHILQDLRGSRMKHSSLIIPYVLVGLGVGATMGAILEVFFLPIFLSYVIGYLCVGGMYIGGSHNDGSILTETGVIDVSNHNQVLQIDVLPSIPKSQRSPISWLFWTDIIHFEIYYGHTVLQSELGRLEVAGGKDVVEMIMEQIEFEPTQWILTNVPVRQIRYSKNVRIRMGPLKTYQLISYSATIGDKK